MLLASEIYQRTQQKLSKRGFHWRYKSNGSRNSRAYFVSIHKGVCGFLYIIKGFQSGGGY